MLQMKPGAGLFPKLGPLPSLTPFLTDIADHLVNQYLLEFLANPIEEAEVFRR